MKNKKVIYIVGLIVISIIALYLISNIREDEKVETNVKSGVLPGYTDEQIKEITEREKDSNSFSFEINSRPIFINGESEGNLRIANPPYSNYAIDVEIYLDDTEELIYKSDKIDPNQHIQYAKLQRSLDKGEYKATAIIKAYDTGSYQYKGQSVAGLIISVKE